MIGWFGAGVLFGFIIGFRVHQAYYRGLWSMYKKLQRRMGGR